MRKKTSLQPFRPDRPWTNVMLASSNYHFAENVTICLYKEDTFELIWICLTDLSAEDGGKGADEEDADDAHDEGEDGGEEEAPPFPLLIIIIIIRINVGD